MENRIPQIINETVVEVALCVRCKLEKPKSHFKRDVRYSAGVGSWCISCFNQYRKERRAANIKIGRKSLIIDGKKRCNTCFTWKLLDEFHKQAQNSTGRIGKCKQCLSNYRKELSSRPETIQKIRERKNRWASKNKLTLRERDLKKAYGITVAQYNAIFESQGLGCAICGVKENQDGRRHSVDHDHSTNVVRGILCTLCNRMLGLMRDNPKIADAAASYLRKHGKA